jgi:hypothetical protein
VAHTILILRPGASIFGGNGAAFRLNVVTAVKPGVETPRFPSPAFDMYQSSRKIP